MTIAAIAERVQQATPLLGHGVVAKHTSGGAGGGVRVVLPQPKNEASRPRLLSALLLSTGVICK